MIIIVCLDTTRCVVKRLLSRPWKADPILKHAFEGFVGSGSIVQLIDGSHIFKLRLEKSQKYNSVVSTRSLRNLCASQNRFSSHINPKHRFP